MAILTNSFEGGTNGTVISTANSGGASGNAFDEVTAASPIFTTARAAHGSMSAEIAAPGTNIRYMRFPAASPTSFQRGYYFITAADAAEHTLLRTSAASGYAEVILDTSGKLALVTGGYTKQATAPTAIPFNTWIRVELYATAGTSATTGTARMAYYTLDDTTPIWDSTLKSGVNTASTGATFVSGYYGKYDNSAFTGTMGIDAVGLKTGTDAVWGAWPVPAPVVPPTPVADDRAVYLIDFSGSTASAGGALSFSITQTSGTTTTPELLAPGIWAVEQSTTESLGYTVTVTEAGGGTASQGVVVPSSTSVTNVAAPLSWDGSAWV